jgi:hypothetical protein
LSTLPNLSQPPVPRNRFVAGVEACRGLPFFDGD